MKTIIATAAVLCLALPASAQEPGSDAIDRVQRRLAEAALLVRPDAGKTTCREKTATIVLRVNGKGLPDELRIEGSTGRSTLDEQLPQVLALGGPYPELAGAEATLQVKFACLTN